MDVWLAQQCDYMLAYEADTYNALRPIAYTNWPTLDPLTHPTEATTAEEARWRRARPDGSPPQRSWNTRTTRSASTPTWCGPPRPTRPAGSPATTPIPTIPTS